MPPRPSRSAAKLAGATAAVPAAANGYSTSPTQAVNPSLVTALEHIPPTFPRAESPAGSDELTPPPEHEQPTKDEVTRHVVDEIKAELDEGSSELSEPIEPVEEKAVPKKRGGRKPKAESKAETTDAVTPKKRGRAAKDNGADANAGDGAEPVTPVKRARKTPKKNYAEDEEANEEETAMKADGEDFEAGSESAEEKPKKARKKSTTPKKPTPKRSKLAELTGEPEYDEDGNEIPKKKKKVKVYPKIEYDIPPVERKHTTFRGRLGYACLNTVLRSTKPDSIFCSRTCRIASIEEEGMALPKALALANCRDLLKMIQWNEDNKIRFLRLSSEMFPFASHEKYGYNLEFAAEELKAAGDLAKKYGHRLTMHPGQACPPSQVEFTQIGSPKPAVVKASIRELEYQCEIMDRMGLNQDGVMIIHMGGVYGDKPSTLARFKENYVTLPDNIKGRLVLENDEICYNVDDLFPVCDELNIPIIFDYHHDWINPSCEPPAVLIPRIAEIWKRKGIKMKQHLSEPRPGAESVMERRAHADRCKSLPDALPDDVDLMIEAKDKEQAVFELYRIYGLEDVIHDNLRPPDPEPGMHTKGRKSALKKKVKETGDIDSEGEPVQLSDIEKEGDGGIGDESSVSMREVKPTPTKAKRGKNAKAEEGEPVNGTNGQGEGVESDAKQEPGPATPLKAKRGRKASAAETNGDLGTEVAANGVVESKPKRGRKKQALEPEEAVFEA